MQCRRRLAVRPVQVIDQHRRGVGGRCQQQEGPGGDQVLVPQSAGRSPAQRRRERLPLHRRQVGQPISHRRQQLEQRRVTEGSLRLTPWAHMQVNPPASSSAARSSVVLPIPASPSTTKTPITPPRAASSRAWTRTRASSSPRPTSPAGRLRVFPDAGFRVLGPPTQEESSGAGTSAHIDHDARGVREDTPFGLMFGRL